MYSNSILSAGIPEQETQRDSHETAGDTLFHKTILF